MVDCCVLRIVCDEMSVYELVDDARLTMMHVRQRVYCFYNCNNAIVVDGGGSVIIFICLYYLLVR